MVSWSEFEAEEPELARCGAERFEATGVVLVGTTRRDGSVRISPVEPVIHAGQLYLGMMWQSKKALDLLRDPRILVHSSVCSRDGGEGEFKLRGRARPVADAGERASYAGALEAKIGWQPEDEYHLFAVDVEEAAVVRYAGGAQEIRTWSASLPGRLSQAGEGILAL